MTRINAQNDTSINPSFSPLMSSSGLGWQNLVVEQHSFLPREFAEFPLTHHMVELASGQHMSHGERPHQTGHWTPYWKPPGNINLFTDGARPAVRSYSQLELTIVGLDPRFAAEVAQELDIKQLPGPADIHDDSAVHLMRLLESAAKSGDSSNQLYLDHVACALTLRLFSSGENRQTQQIHEGALPLQSLRRVMERMRSDLVTNLDLKTLAAESGYSRNHFLRMFRAATGSTPHQFFLQLRVEKAQSLMKNKSLRIIDIAASCGFESQAHFSRVFREIVGATPMQYRRDI
ncbi:MAG TPA: AraC family transcriptional regulator [Chthoniobacterales bacterium]|nr:AraC family transcriptional regulator [Chthoniobacterales bacterium]